MKKKTIQLIVAITVLGFVFSACAANKEVDYGTAAQVSLQFNPMPLDQYIQTYDFLVIALCDEVTPKSPWEGYTEYSFSTIQVLGGDFGEEHFKSFIPRYDLGEFETGTSEYEAGKTYILPLMRVEEMFDIYYQPPYFGTVFCLTDNRYEAGIDIFNAPELKSEEEAKTYLMKAFNAVSHRSFSQKKLYADSFAEFCEESSVIGRMKVVRVEKGIGKDVAYCECVEIYKGQSDSLSYLSGSNLVHIAVLPGTVTAGIEYIIGCNEAKISTKESVKPYSVEMAEQIKARVK